MQLAGTTLLTLLLVQSGSAKPGPRYNEDYKHPGVPTIVDEDTCRHAGRTFTITLPSPTGFPDEDDMILTFEQGGRKVEARWPGQYPAAWWMLDPQGERATWRIGPLCGKVDAVPVEGGLLVLLRQSGRPNTDEVVGVLYDVTRHEVLDMKVLGAEGDLVDRADGVIWFELGDFRQIAAGELIRSRRDELVLPDGDRLVSVDGDATPVNPVLEVRVEKRRILKRVDPERTVRVKKWTRIFSTGAAYRDAFGDAWAYIDGKTATGRYCVQAATQEAPKDWRSKPWHCEAPRR